MFLILTEWYPKYHTNKEEIDKDQAGYGYC